MPEQPSLELARVIHEHYKDTCGVLERARGSRDRAFYACLAILGLMLFDAYSPADFFSLLADVLRKQLGASAPPNLAFLRTVSWFLLLGVVTKYCQMVVMIERLYPHLHALEAQLAAETSAPEVFTREGAGYLMKYPVFLNWAHFLYRVVFPVCVVATVTVRVLRELPQGRWPVLSWVDLAIALAVWMSVVLYLLAVRGTRNVAVEASRR